jgi:hypothetical protein
MLRRSDGPCRGSYVFSPAAYWSIGKNLNELEESNSFDLVLRAANMSMIVYTLTT